MADILIIDDEESLRYTLSTFLETEGHTVRTASSLDKGLERMTEAEPDLVLVDILLGNKSGIDLVRHAADSGLAAPVIIITGQPSLETAMEAVRLGAFDYAIKPVTKDKLLSMTRLALRHRQMEADNRRLSEELAAIFRSVPEAILTVDENLEVQRANEAVEAVLGVAPDTVAGMRLSAILGECAAAFERVVEETLRTGKPVKEYRFECAPMGRGRQTMILNCAPLRGSRSEGAGKSTGKTGGKGAVLVARDITVLAGLERQLQERRQFRRLVGKSPAMQEIYSLLQDLGDTETTVLITGQSGTGKELAAEALHNAGRRAGKPLVKVNCSALSENLLESELFGHVRGAFTGAVKDKVGRFRLAEGGSIFLDEIGDISPRIQLKLLRVLQEKEFERVGDSETMQADVRVITATNQDLREKVRRGEFREDLYYRLKVVEIVMPSLSKRREDIPLLIDHFMELFSQQFGKSIQDLSEEARAVLFNHSWPGNVRELRHAMEHAFILCRGSRLELEHLPPDIREQPTPLGNGQGGGLTPQAIRDALAKSGGNKAKAARILGVSRQTIYRKLTEFDLV